MATMEICGHSRDWVLLSLSLSLSLSHMEIVESGHLGDWDLC
jgi:hypothetical protein